MVVSSETRGAVKVGAAVSPPTNVMENVELCVHA